MNLVIHSQTSTVSPLKFTNRWEIHTTLYNWCNYLSMLASKINHFDKRRSAEITSAVLYIICADCGMQYNSLLVHAYVFGVLHHFSMEEFSGVDDILVVFCSECPWNIVNHLYFLICFTKYRTPCQASLPLLIRWAMKVSHILSPKTDRLLNTQSQLTAPPTLTLHYKHYQSWSDMSTPH